MNTQQLIWLGIPALALVGWFAINRPAGHERINGVQARELVRQGARLVDVRTAAEFDTAHIPDATNVPVQQLRERLQDLGSKDRPIVLYCRSGHRSGMAYDQLKREGFTKLYDLGPMTAW